MCSLGALISSYLSIFKETVEQVAQHRIFEERYAGGVANDHSAEIFRVEGAGEPYATPKSGLPPMGAKLAGWGMSRLNAASRINSVITLKRRVILFLAILLYTLKFYSLLYNIVYISNSLVK